MPQLRSTDHKLIPTPGLWDSTQSLLSYSINGKSNHKHQPATFRTIESGNFLAGITRCSFSLLMNQDSSQVIRQKTADTENPSLQRLRQIKPICFFRNDREIINDSMVQKHVRYRWILHHRWWHPSAAPRRRSSILATDRFTWKIVAESSSNSLYKKVRN